MMKFSDFGFRENPFSITPDPRYLFLSRGHEESLAHLIYGTGPNGGFVQLTGEVGTGKTMLVRSLLAQKLENVDIALILNPRLSRRDFMAAICDELGVPVNGSSPSLKQIADSLTRHLLTTYGEGRHTVLVVDEAQNLSPQVLEQVRLLTNLETARHKLLRIILVGQPELQQLLARDDLRQVDQRITARYHLTPMSGAETAQYVRHRLAVAGISGELFTPMALRLIHLLTRGVPRMINTLCERSLLAVFATGAARVTPRLVWRAWREIRGEHAGAGFWRPALAAVVLLGASIVAGWWFLPRLEQQVSRQPIEVSADTLAGAIHRPQPSPVPVQTQLPPDQPTLSETPVTMHESHDLHAPAELPLPLPAPVAAPMESQPSPPPLTLYQRLFALWGETVSPAVEENPCNHAIDRGLRCVRGVTDWQGAERMNRPLLLRLPTSEGERRLLLLGMQSERVRVLDEAGEREIDRAELTPHWQGDFFLLWRPPKGESIVGPGSRGEAVTWVRERLSLWRGEPAPMVVGVDHFDAGLEQELQAFQRANGLHADGVAGPQTLIALMNLQPPAGMPNLLGGL